MSLENFFPYKPLGQEEIDTINKLCGGSPITRLEPLEGLFQYLARPMINGLAKQLLVVGSKACAQSLDTNPQRSAQMFQRGALLYTAILAEFSPLSEVPCKPAVFLDIEKAEGEEFIRAAKDRMYGEVRSFCVFLGELSLPLDINNQTDLTMAISGAGLVHTMTTESLRPEESDTFELEHPELADLEPLFRDMGNQ